MNINRILTLFIIVLFTFGCDSSLVTESEENSTQKQDNPESNIEIIENTAAHSQVTCSPNNTVKILLTQKLTEPIYCREKTSLKTGLNAGPVCPGGVTLAQFSSQTSWKLCEELSICGKTPSQIVDLKSSEKLKLKQLQFTELPWGCAGVIEVSKNANGQDANILPFEIVVPSCELCSVTNLRSCEVCGVDNDLPTIIDVFTESFVCNQVRVLVFAEDSNSGLHLQAYSFDKGLSWQSDNFKVYEGLNLNLPIRQIWVRDRSGNIAKYDQSLQANASPCPCETPWGDTIVSGVTRTAYSSATVNCSSTCESNSQQRTCNNGVLSGSNSFSAGTCEITGCPKCNLPWGEQIQHGESVVAYNKTSAACKGECLKTTLSCDHGVLQGNSTTYAYKNCSYNKVSCNCKYAGAVLANGQSKTVFQNDIVNCGATCTPGSVTCSSGTLTGDTGYSHLSCSPKICKCTTAWGELVDPNVEIDAFKNATIACDQSVVCHDQSNYMKIKCTNVNTNTFEVVEGSGKISDFGEPSCSHQTCGCAHLGVLFKPSDLPLKVYKIEEASSPASCELAGNSGEVTCRKVGSIFIKIGDTNETIYPYTQCEDVSVPGSGGNDGNSPDTVGPGDGGGGGGGTGNDEGDGDGFRPRGGGFGTGSGCNINLPPYFCFGGGVSMGLPGSGFCLLPSENGYDPTVTDNQFLSHRISTGGTITAYSRKVVACNDSCAKYSALISCTSGSMSEKSVYKYLDCREDCP